MLILQFVGARCLPQSCLCAKSSAEMGIYMKKDGTTESLPRQIMLYVLCAVLVIFYLLVLWWGSNPKVGIEYRMYYLTHELSDWPGYGKLSYALGTEEYCTQLKDRSGREVSYTVCRRKGQGWEKEQYDGSINSEEKAYMYYLPQTSQQKAVFSVEINEFQGTGTVLVYADDEQIGRMDAEGRFDFTVPEVHQDKLLTIRFEAQDCKFRVWKVKLG